MLYFSASYIFPISGPPVKNGVLVIDESGKIIDLLDPLITEIPASMPIKHFEGILCPGFINAHCHLELSHLRGMFSMKKGLPFFIGEMVEKRDAAVEFIEKSMHDADKEMYEGGIVAVGDISNNTHSIAIKKKSPIYYHNFIELFDIVPEKAEAVYEKGLLTEMEFQMNGLVTSLVPHAPYTVSDNLLRIISAKAVEENKIVCIHNQETFSENEMFERGTGDLLGKMNRLTKSFGTFQSLKKTSLARVLEILSPELTLQLVHNTYSRRSDVQAAKKNKFNRLYWCLCVNANLFIENALPDLEMLLDEDCRLTIGTDSYASNTTLSMLDELKTISKNFPAIGLDEILEWSTLNGAFLLNIDKKFGSFEKGKTPGVNFIKNQDTKNMRLSLTAEVQRLI
jgi:cytosine/adenosine deaminase-related metal-dependent hydrolase